MTMLGHLSNDEFLERLADLLNHRKHGSVFLVQKPLLFGQDTTMLDPDSLGEDNSSRQPSPIIIRATDGKGKRSNSDKAKVKLSTVVKPDSIDSFFNRYADVCKASMPALKPRDKLRKKKQAKARRRKVEGAGKKDVNTKPEVSSPAAR